MKNLPGIKILTIDIGGSHIKATLLDAEGTPVSNYERLPTPKPSKPENILETIQVLVKSFEYDKISVGFPGYVKNGGIKTAPNLGTDDWKEYDLKTALSNMLHKPAKVVNDADLQGSPLISCHTQNFLQALV